MCADDEAELPNPSILGHLSAMKSLLLLLFACRLIAAEISVEIGSHCLISWGVGIADSDFHPTCPFDP